MKVTRRVRCKRPHGMMTQNARVLRAAVVIAAAPALIHAAVAAHVLRTRESFEAAGPLQTALFLLAGGGRKIDTLFLDSYFHP